MFIRATLQLKTLTWHVFVFTWWCCGESLLLVHAIPSQAEDCCRDTAAMKTHTHTHCCDFLQWLTHIRLFLGLMWQDCVFWSLCVRGKTVCECVRKGGWEWKAGWAGFRKGEKRGGRGKGAPLYTHIHTHCWINWLTAAAGGKRKRRSPRQLLIG